MVIVFYITLQIFKVA